MYLGVQYFMRHVPLIRSILQHGLLARDEAFVLSSKPWQQHMRRQPHRPGNYDPTRIQLQQSLAVPDGMMYENTDISLWTAIQGCVHNTQQWGIASAPTRLNRSSSRHTTRRPHHSHSSMRRRDSLMLSVPLYLLSL